MTRTIAETTRQRLLKLGIKHFGREELARRCVSGESTLPNPEVLPLVDLQDGLKVLGDDA
jgi:hypothetical protein